jgi:hypothetical protein
LGKPFRVRTPEKARQCASRMVFGEAKKVVEHMVNVVE